MEWLVIRRGQKVVSFESYCPHAHIYTHTTECCMWTTKMVSRNSRRRIKMLIIIENKSWTTCGRVTPLMTDDVSSSRSSRRWRHAGKELLPTAHINRDYWWHEVILSKARNSALPLPRSVAVCFNYLSVYNER